MKTTPGHIRISDAMWERLHPTEAARERVREFGQDIGLDGLEHAVSDEELRLMIEDPAAAIEYAKKQQETVSEVTAGLMAYYKDLLP